MANRRPQIGGRRPDFIRNDRNKNFGGRSGVSPWQGAGPGTGLPNLLPLGGGSTEATLALASNIINLLQPRQQNPVPSLLDMPIRRDFGPNMGGGRYDRGYVPNRMGNQGNFRRSGNYNRAGERMNNHNRKPSKPNDGPRLQNKNFTKKDADSKAKPVKESSEQEDKNKTTSTEQSEGNVEDSEKKEVPKSRYDEIHQGLLKCHICNKSMWDGRSFENHLNGRAHSIMMQKTAESYALTADTMRQEIKIREMKRTRKAGQQPSRDFYCAMCDMYAADGPIHRTTVGHRKLKKYLHPTCTSCHKEMPTRIELDEHRLTAEHLKVMQDKQEVVSKPKPEVMVISTLAMEQTYLRDDRPRWRRGDTHDERRHKDKDGKDNDEEKKDQDGETAEGETVVKQEPGEEKKEEQLDSETTVLDYKEGDDVSHVTEDMFPAYSTERGVGRSFLSEFRCVQCRLCRKLLDSDETAETHLRTWRHHQLFLRLLTDKSSNKQQQEQEEEVTESTPDGNKRAIDSEENGNWKRRKTAADEDNNLDDSEDVHMKADVSEEPLSSTEADADAELLGDPRPDDLEDWNDHDEAQENGMEAEEAEKAPSPSPAPEPQPATTRSPRARGRGRGRGRRGRF